MKVEGKVAIVAGGGQGIGQGIVHCLSEEGADVAVIDINGDTAKKVAGEVEALDRKSLAIKADVTNSKNIAQAVRKIIDTFGKIDILVNNVGGAGETTWARTSLAFVDQKEAEWDETFAINLKSHVLMCRAVVPYFIKQKSGKIVNIASNSGKLAMPILMQYAVVKASVIHFTRVLAKELGVHNINVNCINPGGTWTPLQERFHTQLTQLIPEAKGLTPRELFSSKLGAHPLQREQTPEDIGHAVVFFASEDARNITGQCLNVDRGETMF